MNNREMYKCNGRGCSTLITLGDRCAHCEIVSKTKPTYEDCIKESESMTKSIISACESVGRDTDGKFPFNAYDLAQRIIRVEAELKSKDDLLSQLGKKVEGLEKENKLLSKYEKILDDYFIDYTPRKEESE